MAKKRYVAQYSHKQIRKSIKRDELRELIEKAYSAIKHNTENVLIAGIIIVVLVILIPLYFKTQADNELRANNLFNRAEAYSRQPVNKRLIDPSNEAFRSSEEKYKKVRDAFGEVTSNYQNSRVAKMAKIEQASANYFLNDYAQAQALYQEAQAQQKDPFLQGVLLERIGNCQENLSKWQEALQTYRKLEQDFPDYFNQRSIRLATARCLWHLNQKAESRKLLEAEQAQEPGSYWAEMARQQIKFMEAE